MLIDLVLTQGSSNCFSVPPLLMEVELQGYPPDLLQLDHCSVLDFVHARPSFVEFWLVIDYKGFRGSLILCT